MSLFAEKDNEDLMSIKDKWSRPIELQIAPVPRTVKLSKNGKINLYLPVFLLLALFSVFVLAYREGSIRAEKMRRLMAQGEKISGVLASKNITGGKGAHYHLHYGYRVGDHEYRNSAAVSKQYYNFIQIGTPLQVVFLPQDPAISKLEFERPMDPPLFLLFLPLIFLLGPLFIAVDSQKQKKLLVHGTMAPARVDKSSRNKSSYRVHYRFLDEYGTAFKGMCTLQYVAAPVAGEITTVLYMPGKPSVNRLYTGSAYELVK